ncbi:uncharacterized protein LOC142331069 [Lycorma delicatula]|uniref:uncharacterized protein LOC142331069 n=1 Tax=Lycorma delicatula TaxID=130591 RepID=UPI003F511C57
MTTAVQRQKTQEYKISNPKTVHESIQLTKILTSVMLSQISVDRKFFNNLHYVENTILGIPVKIIKCENPPEIKFSLCLKMALKALENKSLQSIKLLVESKENRVPLEEYVITYKYENNGINFELSQENKQIAMFAAPEAEKKMKESIAKMIKNEKKIINSVNPLPKEIIIKMQLRYNKDSPILDEKYFTKKPAENDDLKHSCTKLKIGKAENVYNSLTFGARSRLIKEDTTVDEEESI